jgi:hypothetical protein
VLLVAVLVFTTITEESRIQSGIGGGIRGGTLSQLVVNKEDSNKEIIIFFMQTGIIKFTKIIEQSKSCGAVGKFPWFFSRN